MVASKSAKTVKLSYPERVLGAFSQVQKEHKRNAVHALTLRAQIKKAAQARGDTLGPHWSSFVGKAVQKLENEGILAASNSAGSLILTAHGKEAIADARRALSISPHAALTSDEEELVWRQVAQQNLGRGVKRVRLSSFLPQDDDDYEEEGELSPVVSSRTKRARMSIQYASPAKTPMTAMSQAELLSVPRGTHEAGAVRTGSPLTDLEEEHDEADLLEDGQIQNHSEITRKRRELREARAQVPNDSRGKSPARFPTPETTSHNASTPTRPGSALNTRSRPPQGITGPQSGSYISNLSQQPTPTPSSHRTGVDDDEPPGPEDARDAYTRPKSLTTPDRSPSTSRANLPSVREPSIAEKVADLERQLGSRKWDLERLQAKYAQLQDNYLTLEDNLIDRETLISTLQTNVATLEKQKSETASTLELQASNLSELRTAKDKMETSFSSRVKELEQDIQAREADISILKAEKEEQRSDLSDMRAVLNRTELRVAAQASQVANAERQTAALRSTLEAAAAELEAQQTSQMQLLAEKENLQGDLAVQKLLTDGLEEEKKAHLEQISSLKGSIGALKVSNESMSNALSNSTSESLSVSEKFKALEASNESLLAQLSVAQGERSALAIALKVSEASVASLTSQVASLKDALSKETARVTEQSASLSRAQSDIVILQEKSELAERSVSTLEADLKASNATVGELRTQLKGATDDRDAFASQLKEVQKVADDSTASLTEVRSTLETTTNNLRDAQEATTQIQVTLDTTTAKLQEEQVKNQEMAESLTTKESELREAAKSLAMVESMAGNFREESEANSAIAKDLHTQLLEAQEKTAAAAVLLSAAERDRKQETENHQAAISAFEERLHSARTEYDDLKSQWQSARTAHESLESSFNDQHACLTLTREQLETERARVADLESEVEAAVGKAREFEEELEELRVSKEADEKTIQNLKETFTSLREAQMRSLAELDNQVTSAQSSPVPKRRSARTTASKLTPLKLVT